MLFFHFVLLFTLFESFVEDWAEKQQIFSLSLYKLLKKIKGTL